MKATISNPDQQVKETGVVYSFVVNMSKQKEQKSQMLRKLGSVSCPMLCVYECVNVEGEHKGQHYILIERKNNTHKNAMSVAIYPQEWEQTKKNVDLLLRLCNEQNTV